MSSLKVCTKCKAEKELSEFHKRSDRSTGYNTQCKDCVGARQKSWKEANPNKNSEYSKKYREANLEDRRKWDREYAKANRQKKTDNFRNWRHKNPDKDLAARDRNKETVKACMKTWRTKNKHVVNAHAAKYRAGINQATPKWLTQEHKQQIENLYRIAGHMSEFHEESFHVDHIEPLNGKTSMGLHLPWNLQILPAKENISKSNKLLLT
jgi:hypothetical protein